MRSNGNYCVIVCSKQIMFNKYKIFISNKIDSGKYTTLKIKGDQSMIRKLSFPT